MEHCKTCMYWKHHGPGAVWGDCVKLYDSDLTEITIVNSFDGEEDAKLETHPDFGCVLHKERGENA